MTFKDVSKTVKECVNYTGNNNCSLCTKCILDSDWIDEAEEIYDLCSSFYELEKEEE